MTRFQLQEVGVNQLLKIRLDLGRISRAETENVHSSDKYLIRIFHRCNGIQRKIDWSFFFCCLVSENVKRFSDSKEKLEEEKSSRKMGQLLGERKEKSPATPSPSPPPPTPSTFPIITGDWTLEINWKMKFNSIPVNCWP